MGDTGGDYEKLFLLEVLVDSLFISNSSLNLGQNLLSNLSDTCVMFQFLHYPPLVVCESDFIGSPVMGRPDSSHITFKSGKSCFFSLRLPRGPILPVPFEVNVSVLRKLKEGVLPDKLDIGKTSINMCDEFTELLRKNTDEICDELPLSKTKKGTFEIKDCSGRTVGSLVSFIRISCFGKLIITQFSLSAEDEKSYLFKGTEMNAKLCELGSAQLVGDDKQITSIAPPSTTDRVPAGRLSGVPPVRESITSGIKDRPMGERRGCPPEGLTRDRGYPQPPIDEYRGRRIEERPCGCPIDYTYRPPPPPPPPRVPTVGRSGRGNLCDCPYPVPPSVMSKYTSRTEKNLDLSPGEVGMQDDQVVFQLPLKKPGDPLTDRDKAIDSSVYYKLTSAVETKEGQQKNTVHIKSDDLPGMAGKGAVSPVSGLPADDDHDVFLLKIGKKCDGDKKRNLELELRTPKMKEPKPCMTDRDTQYQESDVAKVEANKWKGKGKGKGKRKKSKK